MRFYRLHSNQKIFGFGDPCADAPLLGLPLKTRQNLVVAEVDGVIIDIESETEVDDESYFIFNANTYFSPTVARFICNYVRQYPGSYEFVLADNRFNQRFVLPDAGFPSEYGRVGLFYRQRQNPSAKSVVIEQKVYANHTPLPRQVVIEGMYHLDQCDSYVASVDTPFHLLQLNMAININRSIGLRKIVPVAMAKRMKHLNTRLYFLGLKLANKKGRGCKIHPTAVLEGVVLGDNVTIGAYAVVRLSSIGSGTTIEDQASVTYSVLGENNYIANKNHVSFCLTYDNVFLIHGPYQFSIFGKDTAVFAVINCDVRMDQQTIKVEGPNGLIDSRQYLLGVAYGHRSKIAGGNIVAPGRIIPNDHVETPPKFIMT